MEGAVETGGAHPEIIPPPLRAHMGTNCPFPGISDNGRPIAGPEPRPPRTPLLATHTIRVSGPHLLASPCELGLTPRQAEVAVLLAARRTNREIAAALSISVHTARHHVEAVLERLGVARGVVADILADSKAARRESSGRARRIRRTRTRFATGSRRAGSTADIGAVQEFLCHR